MWTVQKFHKCRFKNFKKYAAEKKVQLYTISAMVLMSSIKKERERWIY